MTRNQKAFWGLSAFLAVAFFATLFYLTPERAAANPSTVSRGSNANLSTNSATSSPTFMTAGTATSTLTLDATNGTATTSLSMDTTFGEDNTVAVNSAVLLVNYVGSSSANSYLKVDFEFSNDGVNFYQDFLSATSTGGAGLANALTADNRDAHLFRYASSTSLSGAIIGSLPYLSNGYPANTYAINVPDIPTRYIRAVFTTPITSYNGAVWARFVTR